MELLTSEGLTSLLIPVVALAADPKRQIDNLLKPLIVAVLVLELLLAQFAIASPQLHDWMHGESDCGHHERGGPQSEDPAESQENDDHVCLVHIFEGGISGDSQSLFLSVSTKVGNHGKQVIWYADSSAVSRHLARGPPSQFR